VAMLAEPNKATGVEFFKSFGAHSLTQWAVDAEHVVKGDCSLDLRFDVCPAGSQSYCLPVIPFYSTVYAFCSKIFIFGIGKEFALCLR
jgi:hypothetical protein